MHKVIKGLRKAAALIIGVPIVILGLILIPLPGPGILVTALGLYIIAYEFDAAKPYLERMKRRIHDVISAAKR